jgi:lipopolysaccharide export system protein LptA
MSRPSRFPVLLRAALGVAALVAIVALSANPLEAQTLTNSFGGLSQSSKDPIDIESDFLVVHDQQKYATFKGNVKAVQGTTTLRAKQLDVYYVGGGEQLATGQTQPAADSGASAGTKPAASGGNSGAQITKIEAKGDVVITSGQDQTTTSDWALYDVPSQLVTVGGNVVLTQGQNVLKGDRLVIDLKTGESRFENPGNTASGGRIRALFVPNDKDDGKAKSNDKEDGKAKSSDDKSAAAASAATTSEDTGSAGTSDDSAPAPQASKPAQDDQPWSIVPGVAR